MKEQLISFETAKLAKEKGFDEVCSYLYENSKDIVYITHKNSGLNKHFDWYSAPTQSLLQKWLREVYNIHIWITQDKDYLGPVRFKCEVAQYSVSNYIKLRKSLTQTYETYEKTLEKGLRTALNFLKYEK